MKLIFLILSTTLCAYNVIAFSLRTGFNIESDERGLLFKDLSEDENIEKSNIENVQRAVDNNSYWLFTRKNPSTPQIIENGNVNSLWKSNYDSSKPLKVIAHGWNKDGTDPVNTMITAAFLDVDDVNVIVLDWRVSASGDYVSVSVRVPAVGRSLGNFLQWLISTGGGNWNTVHLIGYSMGAHLMGNAGRLVNGVPRRVTGLDPAGPFWSNSYALNTSSGQYVEVIHTNILVRGITEPIGHVDFYANGGQTQPGCETSDDSNRCSHSRSYELFASSVRTNHLVGRQCTNFWQAILNQCSGPTFNMGNGNLSKTGQGIYSVSTGSTWPF